MKGEDGERRGSGGGQGAGMILLVIRHVVPLELLPLEEQTRECGMWDDNHEMVLPVSGRLALIPSTSSTGYPVAIFGEP